MDEVPPEGLSEEEKRMLGADSENAKKEPESKIADENAEQPEESGQGILDGIGTVVTEGARALNHGTGRFMSGVADIVDAGALINKNSILKMQKFTAKKASFFLE